MSVSIQSYREHLFFLINKSQSGSTMTVPQFNDTTFRAILQLFEKDRNVFVETGVASDFFQNYLTLFIAQPNFITGYLDYPVDWEHTSAVRSYYNGNEYPVDNVESVKWGDTLISQLNPPTLRFPKYAEFGDVYRFAPKNIGTVFIDYFRTPTQPIWNYTIVNDEPVYNPIGSVDIDCQQFSVNQIAALQLSLIGINLDAIDLLKFSDEYTQKTTSVI